ncbi:hypothetical protein HanIR_Chr16g0817441 [Helianthus annuus]|nr:hypothetical protein HanIR_Chr16g0817441 [Helianthus annuus]
MYVLAIVVKSHHLLRLGPFSSEARQLRLESRQLRFNSPCDDSGVDSDAIPRILSFRPNSLNSGKIPAKFLLLSNENYFSTPIH